jgi:hypothetical protein
LKCASTIQAEFENGQLEPNSHNSPRTMTMSRMTTIQHIGVRSVIGATLTAGWLTMAACTGATPRGATGGMMGGGYGMGWMGGYGGPWMLILLVVVIGLVGWILARGRNRR